MINNILKECHSLDDSTTILNCLQFSYDVEDTDDIALMIGNGTQHNLTKYNAGVQPTLIIYDMLGEYTALRENDWLIQHSETDFEILNDSDFNEQFELIENE